MLSVEVYVSSVFTMLRGRFEDHEDATLPVAEGRSVLVKLVAVRNASVFASVVQLCQSRSPLKLSFCARSISPSELIARRCSSKTKIMPGVVTLGTSLSSSGWFEVTGALLQ